MFTMIKLNGIFPPLPTAFYNDESLATEKMQENIKKLLNHSLAGFLILGSNGELVHLIDKKKIKTFA
jgi:4-hydroxy-2-oxoglutarate aldolase